MQWKNIGTALEATISIDFLHLPQAQHRLFLMSLFLCWTIFFRPKIAVWMMVASIKHIKVEKNKNLLRFCLRGIVWVFQYQTKKNNRTAINSKLARFDCLFVKLFFSLRFQISFYSLTELCLVARGRFEGTIVCLTEFCSANIHRKS